MKVLLVNGSPHEKGCTYTALQEVAGTLNGEGIDTEIFWIGKEPLSGCISCGHCRKNGSCVFPDKVNKFLEIAEKAGGFIFGSPVHYASAGGSITSRQHTRRGSAGFRRIADHAYIGQKYGVVFKMQGGRN